MALITYHQTLITFVLFFSIMRQSDHSNIEYLNSPPPVGGEVPKGRSGRWEKNSLVLWLIGIYYFTYHLPLRVLTPSDSPVIGGRATSQKEENWDRITYHLILYYLILKITPYIFLFIIYITYLCHIGDWPFIFYPDDDLIYREITTKSVYRYLGADIIALQMKFPQLNRC